MARPGASYPQVEPGAAAMMDARVAPCARACRVGTALETARRTGAQVLVLGHHRAVRRSEVERACRWGLTGLAVSAFAWERLPVVSAGAPEVRARRLLLSGAPMILVRERRRVVGVIDARATALARPAPSIAHRLERLEARPGDASLWLLRVAGKVGEGLGTPVFAVGGFVRDLLLHRSPPDVDLVVEGDGVALARQLREEVGGRLIIHRGFGTASIEGAAGPGGATLGRIDIASARREQYEAPGALPVVSAATIDEDLRRRDFSINALAVALGPSTFGRLLDPLGGQADLARRRLRLLHPMSFVEDPTRIFRAARYATRLGFRLDADAARALRLALRVSDYRALSGQRLIAELELLVAERQGWRALESLVRWGALRLWDPGYRAAASSRRRLRAAGRLSDWARRRGIALDPVEVALIALLVDQRGPVVARCLARLARSGEPFRRLNAAATAGPLARRLEGTGGRRPSEIAEALRAWPVQVLVGAWLHGGRRARRHIEWFLHRGRQVAPRLSGDDLVELGVPRGPAVGACLAALTRLRLDGRARTERQEREFVRAWRPGGGPRAPHTKARGGST